MNFQIRLPLLMMALALPAVAQFAVENLVARVPEGYKIDNRGREGGVSLTQMVPQAESVNEWTEMLALQTFLGARNIEPEGFRDEMRARGLAGCKEPAAFSEVGEGVENGYPFVMWSLGCPKAAGGKPEYTWYKAIKGNDAFYVVIKTYRKDPSTEQEAKWLEYFKTVVVCDPRLKAQACRER
jgi:hypothetical protein